MVPTRKLPSRLHHTRMAKISKRIALPVGSKNWKAQKYMCLGE